MADLIHLNGPPGIGKSTIARRFVAEHHGTLNCDVDVLRTLVGGWSADFGMAGALIRPAAIAMIEAYLSSGHDVVLPQMLCDPAELSRFEQTAGRARARFIERFLMDDVGRAVGRFSRRGSGEPEDPWHVQVRDIVAASGGEATLRHYHSSLQKLISDRPGAVVIQSREGDAEGTYRRLVASLG